jgi:hypothetical protein
MKSKSMFEVIPFFVLCFLLFGLIGCEEPILPTLTTTIASSITPNSANSGGEITADGGGAVTEHGVCWSTSQNPTIAGSHTSEGPASIGVFTSTINGLSQGNIYFVRAYATNSVGTAYGNEQTFRTKFASPIVMTMPAASITATSALLGGNVMDEGLSPITQKGIVYGTTTNPTIAGPKALSSSGIGSYLLNVTPLQSARVYYFRAFATNSEGTFYGNEFSFTTL